MFNVIGNGKTKDTLTFAEKNITNHIHSIHDTEGEALRVAHWLNRLPIGLQYHVEESK